MDSFPYTDYVYGINTYAFQHGGQEVDNAGPSIYPSTPASEPPSFWGEDRVVTFPQTPTDFDMASLHMPNNSSLQYNPVNAQQSPPSHAHPSFHHAIAGRQHYNSHQPVTHHDGLCQDYRISSLLAPRYGTVAVHNHGPGESIVAQDLPRDTMSFSPSLPSDPAFATSTYGFGPEYTNGPYGPFPNHHSLPTPQDHMPVHNLLLNEFSGGYASTPMARQPISVVRPEQRTIQHDMRQHSTLHPGEVDAPSKNTCHEAAVAIQASSSQNESVERSHHQCLQHLTSFRSIMQGPQSQDHSSGSCPTSWSSPAVGGLIPESPFGYDTRSPSPMIEDYEVGEWDYDDDDDDDESLETPPPSPSATVDHVYGQTHWPTQVPLEYNEGRRGIGQVAPPFLPPQPPAVVEKLVKMVRKEVHRGQTFHHVSFEYVHSAYGGLTFVQENPGSH
ncbi:hypothetical protein CVT26_008905 [Gymnopilus dilepis]|uniref:Uncharacterized protein n=1 Tax=Gymnopilus dilepis TaxID=231916 RepID=A0A409YAT3_9AGAR|nr:hypothetical protein CVT26_008905 [Gymnopilus dilepis]